MNAVGLLLMNAVGLLPMNAVGLLNLRSLCNSTGNECLTLSFDTNAGRFSLSSWPSISLQDCESSLSDVTVSQRISQGDAKLNTLDLVWREISHCLDSVSKEESHSLSFVDSEESHSLRLRAMVNDSFISRFFMSTI